MFDFNESLDVWEVKKKNDDDDKVTEELGPIIGIDLGSSNSCVSLWHTVKNRTKVVKNITSKSKQLVITLIEDELMFSHQRKLSSIERCIIACL